MEIEQLQRIQRKQLEIMDEIHRVCQENGLKYYMIGGTALGSKRHKGFIPWDVDIDIAMPRKDYEQFVTFYSKDLKPEFRCHDYRTDKKHFSTHAIVALSNSKILFNFSHKAKSNSFGSYGLYVDILPLDQIPDSVKKREWHEKKLKKINKWRRLKACEIYPCNSIFTILIKHIVSILLPVSLYRINRKQQRIAKMYNDLPDSECKDLCSTLSHYSYSRLCMPKSVWGKPTPYLFEDREYYGPEKLESYLTSLFGNYMKLPSLEHQESCQDLIQYAEWTDESGLQTVGEK